MNEATIRSVLNMVTSRPSSSAVGPSTLIVLLVLDADPIPLNDFPAGHQNVFHSAYSSLATDWSSIKIVFSIQTLQPSCKSRKTALLKLLLVTEFVFLVVVT